MSAVADSLAIGPGPSIVGLGFIPDGGHLQRDGGRIRAASPLPINSATFTWTTDDLELWITYAGGACNITLPPSTDVVSWVPGTAQLRRIRKFNTTANGVILTPQTGCRINGGALATAMNPIPGTAVTPSLTVAYPGALVFRATATDYHVLG